MTIGFGFDIRARVRVRAQDILTALVRARKDLAAFGSL